MPPTSSHAPCLTILQLQGVVFTPSEDRGARGGVRSEGQQQHAQTDISDISVIDCGLESRGPSSPRDAEQDSLSYSIVVHRLHRRF